MSSEKGWRGVSLVDIFLFDTDIFLLGSLAFYSSISH